jgi:sensor histidine kinase YesM
MNPHFVFNSLNTLQNFILKSENDRAYSYLVKFSKLLRNILESNTSNVITLEHEIELISRYLEIENLRFEENIRYTITVDASAVPSVIHIPVMMLQPFVENAIWHGLIKKQGEKSLNISFSIQAGKYLQCIIEDNGLGRNRHTKDGPAKKSLASSFIVQRLDLLNKIYKLDCSLVIEDKPGNNGTIVKITLTILQK